jgi:hypothetical protein
MVMPTVWSCRRPMSQALMISSQPAGSGFQPTLAARQVVGVEHASPDAMKSRSYSCANDWRVMLARVRSAQASS